MDHWEKHLKYYDMFQNNYSKYLSVIDFHVNSLNGCRKILDSGAGTGNLTKKMLESGHEVCAADSSEYALGALWEKCWQYKSGLETVRIDLSKTLPFPADYFDGVASSFVIPFVRNAGLYANEIRRVLKKGGILSLSAWLPNDGIMDYILGGIEAEALQKGLLPEYESKKKEIGETSSANEEIIMKNGISGERLVEMLDAAGFERIEIPDFKPYDDYALITRCVK